jgi:hypothetical protein
VTVLVTYETSPSALAEGLVFSTRRNISIVQD